MHTIRELPGDGEGSGCAVCRDWRLVLGWAGSREEFSAECGERDSEDLIVLGGHAEEVDADFRCGGEASMRRDSQYGVLDWAMGYC